jgi:hypothetical protein
VKRRRRAVGSKKYEGSKILSNPQPREGKAMVKHFTEFRDPSPWLYYVLKELYIISYNAKVFEDVILL